VIDEILGVASDFGDLITNEDAYLMDIY